MCRCDCSKFGRGAFIAGAASLAASGLLPVPARSDSDRWLLRLQRMDTGEQVEAPFTRDGRSLYFDGYKELCRVLRDDHVPIYQGWVKIPIGTIEMLWDVQQYLVRSGVDAPLIVHSGYRTPQTNAATEGAAWMSLHMFGKAVDFEVPGVSTEDLAAICRACPVAGGVGDYAGGWVHADIGPKRSWSD